MTGATSRRAVKALAAALAACVALAAWGAVLAEAAMRERATSVSPSGPAAAAMQQSATGENGSNGGTADENGAVDAAQGEGGENPLEGDGRTEAMPERSGAAGEAIVSASSFPSVNWDYWQSVNPSVIGWITVPGTSIDYPIVQASTADPLFYLEHDVYGQRNSHGCLYLDATCFGGLEESRNAVVFGHHMGDGTMFAPLARYADEAFAAEHRVILLQTPSSRIVLEVAQVQVIAGTEAAKRTAFLNDADFAQWWSAISPNTSAPDRVWTLCTCSYRFQNDERTLVYAVERETL